MEERVVDADRESSEPRRHGGIQVFSAPSDGPRVRWKTDLIAAGLNAGLLAVLIIVAGEGSTLDRTTLEFVGELPSWLLWLGQAVYVVGVTYAFVLLIGVGVLARDRLELLRDMLLAALLAVVSVFLLSRFIDGRWPEFAFFELDSTAETFPAIFITTGTAIQAAASPHLTAPMRKIGWTFILAASASAVLGGVTTVSDAVGGLLVGLIAAALIRYLLGTTAGLPSTNRIREGLLDLGLAVDDLRYAPEQAGAALNVFGTSADGEPLFVSVLGRDSWTTRRWTRLWRFAWYHDEGAQHGSNRRQEIEHEALALLLAGRAGVAVPDLVTVGMSARDDALLVTTRLDHTLVDLGASEADDELLDAIWRELGVMHHAGLSHGAIDGRDVWFDTDGRPAFMSFSDAAINATDEQQREDVAALLVATTLVVGADRAIEGARRARGDDALEATLPVLQTAALSNTARRDARHGKLKIGDLRKQTAAALDADLPPVEQLTRVTWQSVLMVVFIGFAASTLISGLAEVGFDTIADTLADARWALVLIALVLANATNYTDAISVAAVAPKPVPVGVTTVEQFAIGFVNIAVPSAAGRVATNARYFQKFGISAVTATTTGAITGFIGFIAQTILIVITILAGKGSIDLSQLEGGGGVIRLFAAAIAIFVVAVIVVAAVPSLRHWAWHKIEKPMAQISEAFAMVRDPRTAVRTLVGALGTELLFGAGLAMCVLAVGGSVSFGEAIFINVTVSLFAGLMPVPGGVGVSEAGLSAGLTAVGVPG
ncbi:MAG: lysylphosphatidylglycerol synthase domain-containing protein, partial [Acidimicrobiales bacterium]